MRDELDDGRRYFRRVGFGEETAGEIVREEESLVFANGFIRFFNDEVRLPNGLRTRFLRLETPERRDGTVVVAVNASDELAVVKQFRYAPRVWTLEFPRGFVGPDDIGPFLTGWREFSEEVGGALDIQDSWSLGRLLPDTGKLHDAPFIMLARVAAPEAGASPAMPAPDATEVIAHKAGGHWISYPRIRELIETGAIFDMFTCAAFARLRPHFDDEGRFRPSPSILRSERLVRADRDLRY